MHSKSGIITRRIQQETASIGLDMNTTNDAQKQLDELKVRHRQVDENIRQLSERPTGDQLKIQRLKKENLALRDEISRIEVSLLPDIIA